MSKPELFFLDSDIFVILAGVNLLRGVVSAAGFDLASTRRLQPLPHMLKRGRLSKKYPSGIRERAGAWCSQVQPMASRPSGPEFARLITIRGIDPGEAELLAAAAQSPGSLLATGDRRACRALVTAEGVDEVKALLKGKIICLETALWMLGHHPGYRHDPP